ncbi:hypothetical protein BKA67DRAFT_587152 [Truncatella angustata]|uniref:Uncharacterized protein n=1 Tax=Truncatella angustata TaxID=152316 RepID=A0A9P8RG41_9PEZI|nr:uncharacterized protein BKA67DRAFT_587152 [Truncatella angustata]KAH6645194.1 hypothetical protein BKA67DRAFT_587152 [Truncatella angustata]
MSSSRRTVCHYALQIGYVFEHSACAGRVAPRFHKRTCMCGIGSGCGTIPRHLSCLVRLAARCAISPGTLE